MMPRPKRRVVKKTFYLSPDVVEWLEKKAEELYGDRRGAIDFFLEELLRRIMQRRREII